MWTRRFKWCVLTPLAQTQDVTKELASFKNSFLVVHFVHWLSTSCVGACAGADCSQVMSTFSRCVAVQALQSPVEMDRPYIRLLTIPRLTRILQMPLLTSKTIWWRNWSPPWRSPSPEMTIESWWSSLPSSFVVFLQEESAFQLLGHAPCALEVKGNIHFQSDCGCFGHNSIWQQVSIEDCANSTYSSVFTSKLGQPVLLQCVAEYRFLKKYVKIKH